MNTSQYTHCQVCDSDVRLAFGRGNFAKAGRVVSGLLKAAEKSGQIEVVRPCSRVSSGVFYVMTPEQLIDIRAEAISRASK